jgi:hypothetical protein
MEACRSVMHYFPEKQTTDFTVFGWPLRNIGLSPQRKIAMTRIKRRAYAAEWKT